MCRAVPRYAVLRCPFVLCCAVVCHVNLWSSPLLLLLGKNTSIPKQCLGTQARDAMLAGRALRAKQRANGLSAMQSFFTTQVCPSLSIAFLEEKIKYSSENYSALQPIARSCSLCRKGTRHCGTSSTSSVALESL